MVTDSSPNDGGTENLSSLLSWIKRRDSKLDPNCVCTGLPPVWLSRVPPATSNPSRRRLLPSSHQLDQRIRGSRSRVFSERSSASHLVESKRPEAEVLARISGGGTTFDPVCGPNIRVNSPTD